jgi:prolyl oligopeptidase
MIQVVRIAAAVALTAVAAVAATIPAPPPTPKDATVDVVQGVSIPDPYRWLENWSDPKVVAWSTAQNERTRAYIDALPTKKPLQSELEKLITATSPALFDLAPRGKRVFATYSDPKVQQPMLVTLNAAADPASRKTLIDPNTLDSSGHIAIDWFVPSNDGTKVAVSLSKNGSEDGTLHVYDVATGKEIDKPIDRVQYPTGGGSLDWTRDGKGFWYTRYPGPDAPEDRQHFYMQVYFHALGSDAAQDPLVLGEKDGLEKVSEVFLDNRNSLNTVMVMVQRGDGNTWAFYVLEKGKAPVQVGGYADKVVYATFGPDGAIYGISHKDSSNGFIVKLDKPVANGLASAKVLVPETDVAILSGGAGFAIPDLNFSGKRLFVRDIVGGPNQVRVFALDGKPMGKLPLPEVASNNEIVTLEDGRVLFNVSTYLRPVYYDAWNPKTGKVQETAIKVVSPVSFGDAEVRRVFATTKDGTKVPVNVVLKKGTKLDGSNPTLLYGYGGYGVSQTPGFLGVSRRIWLDAGGIFAIANIRGGSEYGEKWHEQGMLTKKQNVFDDFTAAAEYLISEKYTSHEKLALLGGSNGGLLMGAVLTQHPGLARAVVSQVGIYDMVRVELDPNGSFNTTEFGTVKDAEQFKALYAYSPYHHVTANTAYPALLMTTGATDGRVNPMHSRKFTAALQADTTSGYPVFLRTNMKAGHGIGSSLSDRIDEMSDLYSFLFDQLGMQWHNTAGAQQQARQ